MTHRLFLAGTLLLAVPTLARADYDGSSQTLSTVTQWTKDSACGPVTVTLTLLNAEGGYDWQGNKNGLEPGTTVSGDTNNSVVSIGIAGYDAACQPTFVQASSGGFHGTVKNVGAPPDVTDTCLDPVPSGPDSACEARGVKQAAKRASIHGSYPTADGHVVRIDLELTKTDEVYVRSKANANKTRLIARAVIQNVPAYFGVIEDQEINETFENPDPTTRFRSRVVIREAQPSGTITLDGASVLAGATVAVSVFMNTTLMWKSPSPELNISLPF